MTTEQSIEIFKQAVADGDHVCLSCRSPDVDRVYLFKPGEEHRAHYALAEDMVVTFATCKRCGELPAEALLELVALHRAPVHERN
jgi:hypothetical protein